MWDVPFSHCMLYYTFKRDILRNIWSFVFIWRWRKWTINIDLRERFKRTNIEWTAVHGHEKKENRFTRKMLKRKMMVKEKCNSLGKPTWRMKLIHFYLYIRRWYIMRENTTLSFVIRVIHLTKLLKFYYLFYICIHIANIKFKCGLISSILS